MSLEEARELAASLRLRRLRLDHQELQWSIDAARLAASGYHEVDGSASAVDWLRHNCAMGEGAVRDRLAVARELPKLEVSRRAMLKAEIGFSHLVVMSHTSSAVARATGVSAPFDEKKLLDRARDESVNRFWHTCQNYVHACSPDDFARHAEELHEQRELTIRRRRDGMYTVWGRMEGASAAVWRAALAPHARRRGREDRRTFRQRLHDAVVEHASSNQQTHLNVTVALETLMALPGAPAGEIEGIPPISQRTVERLACDCNVRRIVLGPKSVITEVGRSRRVVSPATRRAVIARDQGLCVCPDCDRPGTRVHHLKPWAQGGSSDPENQGLVCEVHHRMLHEGGWRMARDEDGQIILVRPPPTFADWPRGPDPAPAAS